MRLICAGVDCVPLDFAALDWALQNAVRVDRDEVHVVSVLTKNAPVRSPACNPDDGVQVAASLCVRAHVEWTHSTRPARYVCSRASVQRR